MKCAYFIVLFVVKIFVKPEIYFTGCASASNGKEFQMKVQRTNVLKTLEVSSEFKNCDASYRKIVALTKSKNSNTLNLVFAETICNVLKGRPPKYLTKSKINIRCPVCNCKRNTMSCFKKTYLILSRI